MTGAAILARFAAPRLADTPGVAAIAQPDGRCGRLYVRAFLRMGLIYELRLSKTTVEMGVRRVRKVRHDAA